MVRTIQPFDIAVTAPSRMGEPRLSRPLLSRLKIFVFKESNEQFSKRDSAFVTESKLGSRVESYYVGRYVSPMDSTSLKRMANIVART